MDHAQKAPSRLVGLLILEKPLPLFNGHPNWFILTNGKHPRCFFYLSGLIYRTNSATDGDFIGSYLKLLSLAPFYHFAISPFRYFNISCFKHAHC